MAGPFQPWIKYNKFLSKRKKAEGLFGMPDQGILSDENYSPIYFPGVAHWQVAVPRQNVSALHGRFHSYRLQ